MCIRDRSYTVAVVFEDSSSVFDNMFYFSIMKTLLKRCMHYGYSLIYSEFSFDGEELRLPEQILSRDVDGLIFLKDIPQSLAGMLGSLGIPFVVAVSYTHLVRPRWQVQAQSEYRHDRVCVWAQRPSPRENRLSQ